MGGRGGGSLDPFVARLDSPMFVVTTVRPDTGALAGCLVGFTTQCSIQPDRFLVCLSQNNHTYRVALHADVLAVHGLASTQRDLAELFGTRTGDEIDKFTLCGWRPGPEGVPILDDCPRWFVGDIIGRFELGNHTGYLLAPRDVAGDPDVAPLTFSSVRDLDAGHEA